MIAGVSDDRWQDAQRAEQAYWDDLLSDAAEFTRTLDEKVRAAAWAAARLPSPLPPGDWVEVGVGPLGVGCAQFLPSAETRVIVGVEPLPALAPQWLALPPPLVAAVTSCHTGGYEQLQARGEDTGLEAGRFALGVCYNVLDHVHDPGAVLAELARVLRPGASLLLGVDTVSVPSLLRFHAWVKRRHPRSIGVRAHPFRFRAGEVIALAERAGFCVRETDRPQPAWRHDLAGRAHRLLLLAEKPASGVVP